MSKKEANLYEGMYIVSATLSEEARKKALERIEQGILEMGGEIVKVHDRARQRLAYEINGHKEGHYFLIYFKIEPSKISDLWREYHLNEDLIRFITLRTESVLEEIKFKELVLQQ
jgi:small subunit ribosomal protein S6